MKHQSSAFRYGLAFLTVLTAGALRLGMEPLLRYKAPFLFFILAVLLTARYGGYGPGLMATALSTLSIACLLLEPRFQFPFGSAADTINLVVFTAGGIAASVVCGQLREALARSVREEARLRLISNNVPQFLWTASPDGVHDFVSARWFEYTGADPAAPIGSSWMPLIHPDDLEGVADDWERLLALRGNSIREFRLRRRDGAYHWFETRTASARDASGRVIKWFGSTVDIQETRELRDQARAEAERFALIVATAPGLICEFCLRPDGTSAMPFASPAIQDIYGLTPEEVEKDASRVFELIHPNDVHALNRSIEESARKMSIWQAEFRINHPLKGETWVVGRSAPVRHPDGSVSWFGIVYDVTARKEAEKVIQELNTGLERRVKERTAQLEEVNSELERFCYTVSHDLRAPLRHVAGYANLLAEEHGHEMSADARGRLKSVQSSAQQMGELIDDLLRFATIGRQPLAPRRTPLNLLVDDALTKLAAQCDGRRIEWRIDELGSAECDFVMMRTVFEELLGNAIKYSRGREPAVIEVERLRIGNEEAAISIRDNGARFDMDFAGKLFGVFERFHKTMDFEGTGIGLATVHRIIHKHGGRVWAEAEVDGGAAFFFAFPGLCRDSRTPEDVSPAALTRT